MNGSPARPRQRPISAEAIEQAAERLALVAEPKRIVLLATLQDGEAGVQELADRADFTHRNTSHHLCVLWRAGVVSRRSEGTAVLYSIEDWTTWWVVEQLVRSVEPAG